MIELLLTQAHPEFIYSRAVGPHLRHIVEHYQALLNALAVPGSSVDYDGRERDLGMQSQPTMTLSALRHVIEQLDIHANDASHLLSTPLLTHLQTGLSGELETTVPTTLGRELLFLSSHTVHHYALLGQYCRDAGVELGHDFGKAPSTIAFERSSHAVSA
jgi:uncharacterized damage-inducible protein DinB